MLSPLRTHEEANALALANVGLVRMFVSRCFPGLGFDEAVGMAWPALVKSAASWDPARGTFSTHATRRIFQALWRGHRADTGTIRVPDHAAEHLARQRRRGLEPGRGEAMRAATSLPAVVSGSEPAGDGGGEKTTIFSLVPCPHPGPAEAAERADLATATVRRLASLPARNRAAVVMRCVLGWEYQRISDRLGLSRQGATWVVQSAVGQLREMSTGDAPC